VRRIKSIGYIPLIPAFSRWRRSNNICLDTYAGERGLGDGKLIQVNAMNLTNKTDSRMQSAILQ
jgi:hypothetical protein